MATDFSAGSSRALRHAVRIAKRCGATLHLFHWVDPTAYALAGQDSLQAATDAAWRDLQQLDADLLVEGLLNGVPDQVLVDTGGLSHVMPRIIRERNIDLVVIGTRGRTGLRKLILGSVAERIFRQAPCPVLTVGPKVRQVRAREAEPRTILFATDFSLQSKGAEPLAFSLARTYSCRLLLLHALEHEGKSELTMRDELRQAQRNLKLIVSRENWVPEEADLVARIGLPADVILKTAEERKVDLIVLGVRAPYRFSDRLMWPNAYRIVCESACPVLTVRTLT